MEEKKNTTNKTVKSAEKKSDRPASSEAEKFAVIKTGGKQYIVVPGRFYDFEKLPFEEGKEIIFEDVLLVADGGQVKIGEPRVEGAKVTGKVLSQFKDEKITVLKYKPKKRYRKTTGHRQQKTRVQIEKIL